MRKIVINTDKLLLPLGTLEYIESNYAYCKLEYCERKDAEYKVIERWLEDDKRRQTTSYLKKI